MNKQDVYEINFEQKDPPMHSSEWLVSIIDDDEMSDANSKAFSNYHDARRHAINLVKDGVASFVMLDEIQIVRCYSMFRRDE